MPVIDDDVSGHHQTAVEVDHPQHLNALGERIRLTELHRRGELTDDAYLTQVAQLD